jgi:hypothetical protein
MAMISVKRRNTSARLLDNFWLAARTIVASHTKTVCSCVRSTLAPMLPYTHFCMLRPLLGRLLGRDVWARRARVLGVIPL